MGNILRRALIVVLVIALAAAVGLIVVGQGVTRYSGFYLIAVAGISLAAVIFERSGYRPHAANPAKLAPTGERFIDPTSGKMMEVWEDSRTGAREYRPAHD